MLPHSSDYYLDAGPDNTFFQIIRNHHEVIISGPPLPSGADDEGCAIQLELIVRRFHPNWDNNLHILLGNTFGHSTFR